MKMPLFFFLLGTAPAWAQQTDTTRQQPAQLETQPQLEALPPATVPQPRTRPATEPQPPTRPAPLPAPADTIRPDRETPQVAGKEKFDLLKKLFVLANGTLNFHPQRHGPNFFGIGVTPMLGYKLTKHLALGPGLVYAYGQQKPYYMHGTGTKAFMQVLVYKNFLAHVENQWLHSVYYQKDLARGPVRLDEKWEYATQIGGGHRSMYNHRFGFDLMVLWQVRSSNPNDIDNIRFPRVRGGIVYHLK